MGLLNLANEWADARDELRAARRGGASADEIARLEAAELDAAAAVRSEAKAITSPAPVVAEPVDLPVYACSRCRDTGRTGFYMRGRFYNIPCDHTPRAS